MGCDIDAWVEAKRGGRWTKSGPVFPLSEWETKYYADRPGYRRHIWDERNYAMFGVLADVRNYSAVPPLDEPRGWPEDSPADRDDEYWDCHSASYYTLKELLDFDWSTPCEDRRVTVGGDGGCTCPPGAGQMTTYAEHCGERFMGDLKLLAEWARAEGLPPEDVRVVFAFNN